MQVNFNGHNGYKLNELVDLDKCSKYFQVSVQRSLSWEKEFDEIYAIAGRQKSLDRPLSMMDSSSCSECGEYLTFFRDSDTIKVGKECKFPGGLDPYSVVLDVPSGKIVFGNDFRSFVICDDPNVSVNAKLGQKLTTEAYAKAGMIHISVGNTCPCVYLDDGIITVENRHEPEYDDNKSEQQNDEDSRLWSEQNKSLGSICTDLWWFSAMDYDYFVKCAEIEKIDLNEESFFVVDVQPGTYSFTDYFAREDWDSTEIIERIIYSSGKRLSDRIPLVIDRKTFGKTVATSHFINFKYGYRSQSRLANLEYELLTLGNGLDWIKGVPSWQTRSDDIPYQRVLPLDTDHPREDSVPYFDVFPISHLYPQSDQYSLINKTPYDVDEIWLAVMLMFVKTILQNFQAMSMSHERHDRQHNNYKRKLAMLCDIASKRNLFDEVLPKHFSDLKEILENG